MIPPLPNTSGIPIPPVFVLDQLSTAPTSAYGLRKLRAAYTGKAINVRRSSDNATQDIGFNATGGLDTASLFTFVGSNNGFVTKWYDQSGSGNDMGTFMVAQQPIIISSGVIQTSSEGNVGIFFGNYNPPGLNNNACLVNPGTSFTLVDTYCVLAAFETGPGMVGDESQQIFRLLGAPGNADVFAGDHNNTMEASQYFPSFSIISENQTTPAPPVNLIKLSYNKITYQVRFSKSGGESGTGMVFGIEGASGVGGGFSLQAWDGWMFEMLFFPSLLGPTDLNILYNNQKLYWQISTQFLLDQIGVTSAGAFSTRRLRKGYTGPALNVRRSSDNTTKDIGFDVNGNLDLMSPNGLLTFCGASNGFVTEWYDQGVFGVNMVQATGVNQPQIVSSGSLITQNGKPVLFFNNPNTNGTIGLLGSVPNSSNAKLGGLFVVEKNTVPLPLIGGPTGLLFAVHRLGGTVGVLEVTGSEWNAGGPPFVSVNGAQNDFITSNLEQITLNGIVGVGSSDNYTFAATPALPTGFTWSGYIGEIISTTEAAQGADPGTIFNNQQAYWNTPPAPPLRQQDWPLPQSSQRFISDSYQSTLVRGMP